MEIKARIWRILEASDPGDRFARVFGTSISALIVLNVAAVIIETVPEIAAAHHVFFRWFEDFSIAVFSAEYLLRLWSCVADPRFAHPVKGRLRFAVSFMALVDLAVIAPFYLPMLGIDLRSVRVLRLMRLFRIVKMGRYSVALKVVGQVLKEKKEELAVVLVLLAVMLVVFSSLMYLAERDVPGSRFLSIPESMWWAVVTVATVGYGDIVPTTTFGKVIAGIVAIMGIGFFALPAGILGSAFLENLRRRSGYQRKCPHCGKDVES